MSSILERVERSIYKAISAAFLEAGYTADTTDAQSQGGTLVAQDRWLSLLENIATTKGWAMEVFPIGSSREKLIKRTPRITIEAMRIMPGDIGTSRDGSLQFNPADPDKFQKTELPFDSSDLGYDIHLVYETTDQYRMLHTLLAKAIGPRRYLQFYDDPKQYFYMEQYNFFDLPDSQDNIEEKVYSFTIKDMYMFETVTDSGLSLINQITLDTVLSTKVNILSEPGIDAMEVKETIIIDLSNYNI